MLNRAEGLSLGALPVSAFRILRGSSGRFPLGVFLGVPLGMYVSQQLGLGGAFHPIEGAADRHIDNAQKHQNTIEEIWYVLKFETRFFL